MMGPTFMVRGVLVSEAEYRDAKSADLRLFGSAYEEVSEGVHDLLDPSAAKRVSVREPRGRELEVDRSQSRGCCNSCGDVADAVVNVGSYDYTYGAASICRACLAEAIRMLDEATP